VDIEEQDLHHNFPLLTGQKVLNGLEQVNDVLRSVQVQLLFELLQDMGKGRLLL